MRKTVIIIILIPIIFFIVFAIAATFLTNRFVEKKMQVVKLEAGENNSGVFTYDQLQNPPAVVQDYFKYAIKDSTRIPKTLLIEQKALFKTDARSGFKDLTAEQLFNTQKPGFVWNADIQLFPLLWIKGIDSYIDGRGNMLIKLLSSITITDAKGKEINQGSLLRYMLESVWFPTFLALNKNADWEGIDDKNAKLVLVEDGILMEVTFYFNEQHQLVKTESERYRSTSSGYILTSYTVYYSNYKEVDGFKIPTHAEVEWNAKEGNLLYGKFDLKKVQYGY